MITNDNARDFRPDAIDVNDEHPGIPLLGMRSKNGSPEVMAVVKSARISPRVSTVPFCAFFDLRAGFPSSIPRRDLKSLLKLLYFVQVVGALM